MHIVETLSNSRFRVVRNGLSPALRYVADVVRESLKMMRPTYRAARQAQSALRRSVIKDLRDISYSYAEPCTAKRVLIDGIYENANYWFRLAQVRAALGTPACEEVAVLGPWNRKKSTRILREIGVDDIHALSDYFPDEEITRQEARQLIASSSSSADVLNWKLPADFPATQAYDALLKKQFNAALDLSHPALIDDLTQGLQQIRAAESFLREQEIDFVLLSEATNFAQGALAWIAVQNSIPVVIVTGFGGMLRPRRGTKDNAGFVYSDVVTRKHIASLSDHQRRSAIAAGSQYLDLRLAGSTNDIGARYAFQRYDNRPSREQLCQQLGWDPAKQVVAIYTSSWFDYPHCFGMKHFRDFRDWVEQTILIAREADHVNWLFKSHPCEDWYGGARLEHFFPSDAPAHIKLAPSQISSAAIHDAADALITVHGTAGIEFAYLGKPVLTADQGFYDSLGFTVRCSSRDEYLQKLSTEWWIDFNVETAPERAAIAACLFYCMPAKQGQAFTGDDPMKDELYAIQRELLDHHRNSIDEDIALVRKWFETTERDFHTFKMVLADDYKPSNVRR